MPRVTCDKCGLSVKEKFAVIVSYGDGKDDEVICKEVIVRVDPQGAFLTKPVSAEKQYESSPIPVTNALGETL